MPEGTKSLSLEEQRALSNPYVKAKNKKKKKKRKKKKDKEAQDNDRDDEKRVASSFLEEKFSVSLPNSVNYRRLMFFGRVLATDGVCGKANRQAKQ